MTILLGLFFILGAVGIAINAPTNDIRFFLVALALGIVGAILVCIP